MFFDRFSGAKKRLSQDRRVAADASESERRTGLSEEGPLRRPHFDFGTCRVIFNFNILARY